jgi:heat shock protein HtpX
LPAVALRCSFERTGRGDGGDEGARTGMGMMKTTLLLAAMTGLFVVVGDLLGGQSGMVLALLIAGVMNFVAYFWSDKIALASYRARPVTREEAPVLHGIVERLAMKAQIPMPRLYVIPDPALNAFATGRSPAHAAVAATEGILRAMNQEELEGVLAHELSHVLNRDTLISTVAATLAGAISMLARMAFWIPLGGGRSDDERGNPLGALLMLILAPLAALLIQMAVSRSREYGADASGARLVGHPMGLASALRKLQAASGRVPLQHASPATAHLFIVNPLSGKSLMGLFSTHPPLEDRIARLMQMNP